MKMSELLMSLLLFSAIAVGLGTFFIGTAEKYSVSTTQMEEFENTFNKYSVVSDKINTTYNAVVAVNLASPLTWGNAVVVIFSVITLMASVPGIFAALITDMVGYSSFIPAWVIPFIEGAILLVIIFGGIKLLSTGGEV